VPFYNLDLATLGVRFSIRRHLCFNRNHSNLEKALLQKAAVAQIQTKKIDKKKKFSLKIKICEILFS